MTDYTKQGEDFLASAGLTFSVRRIGLDCPKFCNDAGEHVADIGKFPRRTHIHGNHYLVTFSRINGPFGRAAEYDGLGWRLPEFSVDFWNSYNDEEFNFCLANMGMSCRFKEDWDMFKRHGGIETAYSRDFTAYSRHFIRGNPVPRSPRAYDVLTCIPKSDPGTFEDFCSEYGYDNDSRKAEDIWRGCCAEWDKARRFFTPSEIEQLQEIQ